jgi:hypothetical protein
VLTDVVVRRKLQQQGSPYAAAESFRVYIFAPDAWAEFLHAVIGSGAEAGKRRKQKGQRKDQPVQFPRVAMEPEPVKLGTPWVSHGALASRPIHRELRVLQAPAFPAHSNEEHTFATQSDEHRAPVLLQKSDQQDTSEQEVELLDEYVDPDPDEDHFGGIVFNKPENFTSQYKSTTANKTSERTDKADNVVWLEQHH